MLDVNAHWSASGSFPGLLEHLNSGLLVRSVLMQVTLEAIQFNHDSGSPTADAFNIRRNESESVLFPEWQRGVCFTTEDSLAAYAIKPTLGQTISIQAKFRSSKPDSILKIRAVDASSPFVTGNILGTVKETEVKFGASGESDFVSLILENVRLESVGVGISKNIWRWQFWSTQPDRWSDFAKTAHKIYSVVDVPQEPWNQVDDANNTQLPWTEVLDVACGWAAGAKDVSQAAELITQNVYDLGLGLIIYEPGTSSYAGANFNCTDFLRLLGGLDGMGKTLNCSDCATIVTSLANILGCRTWEVDLFPGFLTNPVIAISESTPRQKGFVAHEVAFTDDTRETAGVFDACLQIDGDENPADATSFESLLPINLRFGLPDEHDYRSRVSSQNDIEPSFDERHRRRIGARVSAKFVDLDPRLMEFLKAQYEYEKWARLPPMAIDHLGAWTLVGSKFLQGWFESETHSQSFVDGTQLTQLIWKPVSTDPEVLLRVEMYECADWHKARAHLLRMLGEYRSTMPKRLEHPGFADVAFIATDCSSLLFAFLEWVILIRSAGTKRISLRESVAAAQAESFFSLHR